MAANIEFRVPYSQRYLFTDTNHNTNPTNPNNTRYRCEYGNLNSMFARNNVFHVRKHQTRI